MRYDRYRNIQYISTEHICFLFKALMNHCFAVDLFSLNAQMVTITSSVAITRHEKNKNLYSLGYLIWQIAYSTISTSSLSTAISLSTLTLLKYIDYRLNFKELANYLTKKIALKLGVLSIINNNIDRETALRIYKAIILPQFMYR